MRLLIFVLILILVSGCRDTDELSTSETLSLATEKSVEKAAEIVATLTLPAKLDTLKDPRAANSRLRKACYWLRWSGDAGNVIEAAIASTPRGELAKASLRRNMMILQKLGCFDEEDMARLRRGKSPVIDFGPYTGQKAEVDHIVPVSVAPEFGNWIGNLEFMPQTLNRRKANTMGDRQRSWLIGLQNAKYR